MLGIGPAMETISGGHGGGGFNEGEGGSCEVGGVDSEIERGVGFCPAKSKSERAVLGIGLQQKRLARIMVVMYLTRGRW